MKKQILKFTILPLFACIAALVLVAGCAKDNYQKGASTGKDLQASADKINQGSGKIDTVLSSLTTLVKSPTNLTAQYKSFSSSVKDLDSLAKEVSSKFAAMSKQGEAYFAAWDQQIAQIQNEDIKKRSTERKADVQKRFAAIKQSYEEAANEFKPFMSDLKDIQTALATDLTPAGVEAVTKSAERAVKSGNSVKATVGKLATQFKELGVAMSASVPQPAPK